MVDSDYIDIFRPNTSLRTMQPGEQYYASVSQAGFTQYALCEFIGIERGRVVGKSIQHVYPKGHAPFSKLEAGSIIKSMAKKCFLYGKSESDKWPRFHWFKSLDTPVE